MNTEEIIRMAREAGFTDYYPERLTRFAALVAAHEREKYGIPSWETVDDAIAAEREACAKVASSMVLPDASNYPFHIAAAIRAINFEGDTGFRPVSEMVAEHKQDPKKAAAIEKAKMRKAEQKPVAWWNGKETAWFEHELCGHPAPDGCIIPLYAAPVRTKDLTDDEVQKLWNDTSSIVPMWAHHLHFARAVIAKFKEKNK